MFLIHVKRDLNDVHERLLSIEGSLPISKSKGMIFPYFNAYELNKQFSSKKTRTIFPVFGTKRNISSLMNNAH